MARRTPLIRTILLFALAVPGFLYGQGVASRGIQPLLRDEPSGLRFHARFTDVAHQAGLRSPVVYGEADSKEYILETIGPGTAFFDYDNDGWLDVFLLSGSRRHSTPSEATNRLYKNKQDGTFEDVTSDAGLRRTGWAGGVTVGDYDNDGNEDLFLTYWGQNVLYRNDGKGRFDEKTREAGLLHQGARWGSGCTFLDYDRDGFLDLFVANYLKFDFKTTPGKGSGANCNWKGVPVNCGPRGLPAERHFLYHNNGDGTFTDVSAEAGVAQVDGGYGLTAVAADFDGDGWPDIYVACDSTPSLLFRNQGNGTFKEEGLLRGAALSEDGLEQAGMGIGLGDYDLDGDIDIFKTHFADDTNILYRNDGKGYFEDMTVRSGLAVETRFVGWGAGILDLDNNGLPDIFYVTGNVFPEVERKLPQYPHKTRSIIFRNLGEGKFEELLRQGGPGVAAAHSSRGAAFGDYDNDGDLDILIVNLNEPPSLLRNDLGGDHHWLKVQLVGVDSNRSAIGARVTVLYGDRLQTQEVQAQSSFLSHNDRRLHFGLSDDDRVAFRIRWPGGLTEAYEDIEVNQLLTIREGSGIIETQRFRETPQIPAP